MHATSALLKTYGGVAFRLHDVFDDTADLVVLSPGLAEVDGSPPALISGKHEVPTRELDT